MGFTYPYKVTIQTSHGDHFLNLDKADTPQKMERGLMFRSSMPSNSGMVFFDDVPRFFRMWMKNTEISLDMLFFDEGGKIIYIVEKTQPYSLDIISTDMLAKGVVELNAGTVQSLGVKIGDRFIFGDILNETP